MLKKKICRMCGHNRFDKVIDFGKCPLVNSLLSKDDLEKEDIVFPLVVKRCRNCSLVQIVDNIDAHKIYKDVDYLFFSSDMPTLKEYFGELAQEIKNRFLLKNDLVVEIGSNDGVFLQHLKDEYRVLGVDPATNVAIRALSRGISTLPLFFSEKVAKLILREYGKAKVIVGANCIAHLDDLHDLLRGVNILLADDGVFIVECNYWGGMVSNKNYALIYHDHFSYFSLKNWINFLKEYDMEVFDAVVTPAQGGSLRMFIGKSVSKWPKTSNFDTLLRTEEETNLNSKDTCNTYRDSVLDKSKKLFELVDGLKKEGKKIAGYGAAAKGLSILKLANINQNHIDYFVDDSPAKQGKFTPISKIPIISRQEAEEKLPDYFFITAPNYAKVIIEKESKFLQNGGKFILENCEIVG